MTILFSTAIPGVMEFAGRTLEGPPEGFILEFPVGSDTPIVGFSFLYRTCPRPEQ